VDIFFVLSGFLITSIILKDAASAEGFSIFNFWERRIRRILPALLLVIASTVVAGWFILLPSDFMDLGKSVLAQAGFGGNFYFWLSGGYFAAPAMLKPLLHTWSLSVEEQFYLFFPLLFIAGCKWKISTLRWVIGLAALCSLVQRSFHPVWNLPCILPPLLSWTMKAAMQIACARIQGCGASRL